MWYDSGGAEIDPFLLLWVFFAFLCMAIWSGKGGSSGAGFLLGLLLGIFGLLYVAFARPAPVRPDVSMLRECPYCKELMRRDASVCPHCQRESKAWVFHEGTWWFKDEKGNDWWYDDRAAEWNRYVPDG